MSVIQMFHTTGKGKKVEKLKVTPKVAAERLSSPAKLAQFQRGEKVRVRRGKVMHHYWSAKREQKRA